MSGRGGYFQTIIPLPFSPDGSELEHLYGPSGLENLRTLAVARLMLDNFPHVKAFWIMQTLELSQLALRFGVDDIDAAVSALGDSGVRIDESREDTSYGRFAWVYDPENNKIALWEPPAG